MSSDKLRVSLLVCSGDDFDAAAKTLTIRVDFSAGSRFAVAEIPGQHPVHDTVTKRYRHLNIKD